MIAIVILMHVESSTIYICLAHTQYEKVFAIDGRIPDLQYFSCRSHSQWPQPKHGETSAENVENLETSMTKVPEREWHLARALPLKNRLI